MDGICAEPEATKLVRSAFERSTECIQSELLETASGRAALLAFAWYLLSFVADLAHSNHRDAEENLEGEVLAIVQCDPWAPRAIKAALDLAEIDSGDRLLVPSRRERDIVLSATDGNLRRLLQRAKSEHLKCSGSLQTVTKPGQEAKSQGDVLGDMKEYLITKRNLAQFLSVRETRWFTSNFEQQLPAPEWSAPKCDPWYRVGDLLDAFERAAGESFAERSVNTWLRSHLEDPSASPRWADKATTRPAPRPS